MQQFCNAMSIYCFNVIFTVSQDPCLDGNSLELTNMKKRSPSYAMDSTPLCDRYITETWYKATNYIMTASPPGLNRCGTLYPIWLYGI